MKKISAIILSAMFLGVASQASAVPIAPSETPAAVTIAFADCNVVSATSTFTFVASRSVGLAYACSTTVVAVNSGNIKGKYTYGGSSNGGSVKQCTTTAVSTVTGYTIAAPATAITSDGCA